MATDDIDEAPLDFDLVRRGFAHRLIERLCRQRRNYPERFFSRMLILFGLTWLPLAILSLISGHAFGNHVQIPFFRDHEVHARLLFSLPLLELAEIAIALSLSVQAKHLLEMGIIAEVDHPKFRFAQKEALRIRDLVSVEIAILVLSYVMSILLRLLMGFTDGTSSWERTEDVVTLAGWWHMLVSLPILYFFLFRWLFIMAVWTVFLYRVSRLDLELTPTHPDHAGGLGFLGWGLASFSLVLMSISAVVSAGLASEILQHG